ncbi:hypothetical protein GCM10022419_121320 [Nonomuraea rosea]|uniref:YbaB/EbfC family DNA-binding protein n=1 Tax=Nonomuraea rosea TaxID=638574 RepID=A0ABP6ZPJ5_9ACTN
MQGFGDFANIDMDKLFKQVDEQIARIEKFEKTMEDQVGRAQDDLGLVTVECGQEGVRELHLHPKALRLPSGELADLIKAALNDATRDLQQQISEGMDAAFGDSDDNPMKIVKDPESLLNKIKGAEAVYNRTFEDVMGELSRIQRQLEL